MTSRGCPWACTFCGAESSWGRGFRGHSVAYVLDALEAALPRFGEDDADQGRHLHHQQEARDRALPRHPRAQAELLVELRHARRRAERGAALRDAPRRLPAAQPGRGSGLAAHPGRDRQEDHGGRHPRSRRDGQEVRHPRALLHDARQPRRDGGDVPGDARVPEARAAAPVHLLVPVDLSRHARLPGRGSRVGSTARSTSRATFRS